MAVSKWFDSNVYMSNKLAQLKADEPAANWTIDKVVQAFESLGFVGEAGAEAHFMQFGQFEDVAPNAFFNPTEYYRAKAAEVYNKQADPKSVTETEAAFVKAAIKGLGMGAWTHYDTFGSNEKINPSNGFDTEKYMNAKLDALNANLADGQTAYKIEDVYAAFKAAGVNALEHFMLFGGNGKGEVADGYKGTIPDAFKVDPAKQVNGGGSNTEGNTYSLTAGVDSITPSGVVLNGEVKAVPVPGDGDDTFIVKATGDLDSYDAIDGAGGTNTLKLYGATTGGAFKGASIKNVQNVELYNATSQALIDVSKNADVKSITVSNVSAAADNDITVIAKSGQIIGVKGNVDTGTSANSKALVFDFGTSASGTADEATLTLDNVAVTTDGVTATDGIRVAGIEKMNIKVTGENATKVMVFADAKELNISGTGELTSKIISSVDTINKVTASNTGGVDLEFVSGAAGTTQLKDAVFSLSGEDDRILFNTVASLAGVKSMDFGAGEKDTLAFANLTTLTGLDATVYNVINKAVGLDIIETQSAAVTALDFTKITPTTVLLSGAQSGNANLTTKADGSSTLVIANSYVGADGGDALTVSGTGVADTFNLVFDKTTATGITNDTTTNANTALNIASSVKTVHITAMTDADNAAGVTHFLGNGTAATATHSVEGTAKFVIDGNASFEVNKGATGYFAGQVEIDAKALEGKLTLGGSASKDIIAVGSGGSEIDSTAGGDTITFGAGKDVLKGAANHGLTEITGFKSGQDKIADGASATDGTALTVHNFGSVTGLNGGSVYTDLTTALKAGTTPLQDDHAYVVTIDGTYAGTYVVIEKATAGTVADADDIVIKLNGVNAADIHAGDFLLA